MRRKSAGIFGDVSVYAGEANNGKHLLLNHNRVNPPARQISKIMGIPRLGKGSAFRSDLSHARSGCSLWKLWAAATLPEASRHAAGIPLGLCPRRETRFPRIVYLAETA